MTRLNDYGQPIGDPVSEWTPRRLPPRATIEGHFCRLEPINAKRHGADLFAANTTALDGRAWTYLFAEPFTRCEEFNVYLEKLETSDDPLFFAVVDGKTQRAVGFLSLMRIDPAHGVIEVGNINYSPLVQRTPAATEAQYLLMKLAFTTLGYRRFEWKCDSLNAPSRSAALRYGFTFEGIFRQAVVYKGRSRDTAWFSIVNSEWPGIKAAMESWLSPGNFEPDGSQRMSLVDIRQRLASNLLA
ncbi:GNAT family N-acetyltransferase [Ottowia thiooxydans]|uniref:GNAT family N-acetyltransferase n=1 Tax=Ottowia thiooxydans TaxID=219182 RepID=UPI00042087DC|nr:GNAT family protein [Ottowia thiooxydans]